MSAFEELQMSDPIHELTYEAIMRNLFETYVSIYDIDVESSAYQCYHESDSYSELKIAESGKDFFAALVDHVYKVIHPDDCAYVLHMLEKNRMLAAFKKERYYSFVYRLLIDGEPTFHKVRAVCAMVGGRQHILLGVRNVDETIRQEQAHAETLSSMYQKEKNHMEAVLASAAGYIEANLTQDLLLDYSPYLSSGSWDPNAFAPLTKPHVRYSEVNRWLCEHQIVEGRESYEKISTIEYLTDCFARGEKRASVPFSARRKDGNVQPCKEVFFLYQDTASKDVMAFCVIYDLTEQQRKEKEVAELENALQLSRIRNFTSQMQPHFLYNALGSIQEIILEDPEYASDLIGDFTTHLRSCIRAMANDNLIPFAQELSNIKAYVNIEKMRFGSKLEVSYDIEASDFEILPLSIQPLVENAIRHGIYKRGAEGGRVTICSRQTPDAWIVTVEDTGVGFDTQILQKNAAVSGRDSTGLKNMMFRLDKVMHASVVIESVPGQGTKVTVTIPKR